jgi:multidrug efflux system membrane fusion protein
MTARAGGIIGDSLVKQGDRVKEGQVIARIAPEGRDAAVRSAQQVLEQRKAEAEATKRLVEKARCRSCRAMRPCRRCVRPKASSKRRRPRSTSSMSPPYDGVIDVLHVEEGARLSAATPVAS